MNIDFEILKKYSSSDEGLRDYQQDNKIKVYEAWEKVQSVMLQMPTGTGKTRLFVSIIKDIFHYSRDSKNAYKVLVLVHRTELIDQIDEELGYRYGLAHGIIQSGNKERRIYPIQLASVQTLRSRLKQWYDKDFDFIIVDEAHHIEAESYQKIISAFPNAKLLGVTATPVRLSGEGFTGTFEELILSPSVKTFIDKGYLSNYDYYSVARTSYIQQEIDGIKKFSNGDYAESEMERVCDNDRVRAQVVKAYLDYAKGKRGIVYTINKLHNKNLCHQFNENGIKAVAIDSDTPKALREKYIEQFRRGEYMIICNVNLFTEGFDCPDIEFVQLARPTKSLALYLQQVGRGLRISENKEKTLFLDNVGLYNRFGFPSSRRMWSHHFEGKIQVNKKEDNSKENNDLYSSDTIRRERHQNLEEGNEQVHLIITSDENDFTIKQNRIYETLDIFGEIVCNAYNKAYKDFELYGAINIKAKKIKFTKRYLYVYDINFDTDNEEFIRLLKNEKYEFQAPQTKTNEKELRLCNDSKELAEKLNQEFSKRTREIIIKDLKNYQYLFNIKDITIDDIILMIEQNNSWTMKSLPQFLTGKNLDFFSLLFYYSSFVPSKKKDFENSLLCKLIGYVIKSPLR